MASLKVEGKLSKEDEDIMAEEYKVGSSKES